MKTFGQFFMEMPEYPVREDPHQKKIRLSRGYSKLVRIDAAKFKMRFEHEHGERLDWNPARMDRIKDLESVNAYPQVFMDWAGRVDVMDGRHRLATAALRGMSIIVAVPNRKKEGDIPPDLIVP